MSMNRREFVRATILAAMAASVSKVLASTQAEPAMWIELTRETYQEWETFRASVVRMHREYGEIQFDYFEWMLCAGPTPDSLRHVIGAERRNDKIFLKLGCHQRALNSRSELETLRDCQKARLQLVETGAIL